jgi:Kef-type K+ transport system membrane component KefB
MKSFELVGLYEGELERFLLAIILLLSMAQLMGYVFYRLNLPRSIGEITGGLLLGPSCLAQVWPDAYREVFQGFAEQGKLLSGFFWLGLVFLMFVSGFEVQKSFSNGDRKIILAIFVGGTLIPAVAGASAPLVYDFRPFLGAEQNMIALQIVIGVAVGVTSIPVISRIFLDLNIMDSRFAKIVLTTASIEDILLWIALAIATSLVSATEVSVTEMLVMIATTLAFFFVGLKIVPALIERGRRAGLGRVATLSPCGAMLLLCLFLAWLASALNVNVVFGALLAGMIVNRLPEQKEVVETREQIKAVGLSFFIPIYFAMVGLKLDLRVLDPLFFLGFLAFAMAVKTAGTLLGARLAQLDWMPALNLAVAMNARGGPGIVVATLAYDMHIINDVFFVTLVLMAIVTSIAAGSWFQWVINRGWELLREDRSPPPATVLGYS